MTEPGLVSAALEAELREQARQHDIVVWLDKEGTYTAFADALAIRAEAGGFPVPVRRLRGSYLELMLGLEDLEDGVRMTPLIVHVPGHNTDSITETPLLELYRAGHCYQRALPTLIHQVALGRANPEVIEALVAGEGLTVERADAWLAAREAEARHGDGPDLGALGPEALFDALMPAGTLAPQIDQPAVAAAVRRRAGVLLGVDEAWYTRDGVEPPERARSAAELAGTYAARIAEWAMCVELVHDLRRAPVDEGLVALRSLPRPAVLACQRLAAHLRGQHPEAYARIADDEEERLADEVRGATAADLGKIDTFRFEDRVVLTAALDALNAGQFELAHDYAVGRTKEDSFWPNLVRGRQIAWNLVELAAQLGCMIVAHGGLLDRARSLADAVDRYASGGFEVDAAHRRLEQARHQLAHLEIEEAGVLRQRLDELRVAYRTWADAIAARFNGLCRTEGFLPAEELRQRTLFEDVVVPAAADEPTAYFMVDALRYEMGKQLADSLDGKTADVAVRPRLAELPTVTEVGMNALAPVARGGKLAIELQDDRIAGFRAGAVRVDGPRSRHRAISERVGGATCPQLSLEELLDRSATSVRQTVARASLVVVHCEGIDKAGEKGVGLAVFDRELQNLRAAWRLLYEAGIRRFVFTADHGFLLHDEATREPLAHGKLTDPQRRHVISSHRREQAGEVTVGSQELGYDGEPFFVSFPETTSPFDRGDRAKDFVHGGNSLQERVIPVITVRHRHAAGGATVTYQIEARAGAALAGMHCVKARIVPAAQTSLSYGGSAELELALEGAGGTDVQVELCDARGARVSGGSVIATVGQELELFFRLTGDAEERVPVRLRHATRSAAVAPATTEERFQVVLRTRPAAPAAAVPPTAPAVPAVPDWLAALPDGVREVFRQLAEHGSINEQEATRLLGGARQFRNFSLHLEDYKARAPFAVRVDVSSGTKCYVRGDR